MRVTFSTSSFGFLRNFQSTVRLLAERGHTVHLLAERGDAVDGQVMADTLAAEYPGAVTQGMLPSSPHRLWYALGTGVRASLDYWRYLDSRWDESPALRARGASMAPRLAIWIARLPGLGSRRGLAAVSRLFRAVDRALPPSPEVYEALARERPDLLLLTPLLYFGSGQVAHVRAARHLGIRTVVGIGSWDHLTTKGLLHEVPDRVLVWNDAQRAEAIALHGVPADRIVVTGSQAYDHWFAMQPSVDREAFCRRVGLDPSRPLLLYLCSSPFIAPREVDFVRRWITAIRASDDERLRTAGLLVRPHPQNARQWQGVDLEREFGNVALHPRAGVNPIGGTARGDYFDSMYHAEAVVGVNTSGMIESGIVGRPVFTIQADEFAATQEGTLHFQHLKNVEGGLLHVAGSFDIHVAALAQGLADPSGRQRALGFVKAFIRPHGLDVAATPRVVEALEALAATRAPAPVRIPIGARCARVLLAPVAAVLMLVAVPAVKRRSVILRWTRPARLVGRQLRSRAIHGWRGLRSRAIYGWRIARRLQTRGARAILHGVRLCTVRPLRWTRHKAKTIVHTALTRRNGDADRIG